MAEISYDQFAALDLRVAVVKEASIVEGADRLLKLILDVGTIDNGGLGERTVVSGIREFYRPEDLVGKSVIYLANLAPRLLRGIESRGMILASSDETSVALLNPDKAQPAGAKVR